VDPVYVGGRRDLMQLGRGVAGGQRRRQRRLGPPWPSRPASGPATEAGSACREADAAATARVWTSAPSRAMPTTVPVWRVVLATLDASPDRSLATADRAAADSGDSCRADIPSRCRVHRRAPSRGVLPRDAQRAVPVGARARLAQLGRSPLGGYAG
jgi:hypothetical protein